MAGLVVMTLACVGLATVSSAAVGAGSPPPPSGLYTFDRATSLNEVTCPSRSLCVAVDLQGNIWTSSNPSRTRPSWVEERDVAGSDANFGALRLSGIPGSQGGYDHDPQVS
jgi:hypothetical protein